MKSRPNRGIVQPAMWDDLRFPASAGIDTSAWDSLSGMLSCRLYRDAVTDTYADEAAFFEADFHYQKDQVGSRQERIK